MPGITLQEVGGDLVIKVPDESTVIGRGQFLQVTDKRVSRSHALLEVTDGKLYITPTHTNPCFLRTDTSKEQKVLARDAKQLLSHGDEFGLLPDQLFYRVSYPQVNGKDREEVKEKEDVKDDVKPKEEKVHKEEEKPKDTVSNGSDLERKLDDQGTKKDADEDWDKAGDNLDDSKTSIAEKKEEEENKTGGKEKTPEKEEQKEMRGDMAMPLEKKRPLPDWMLKVAGTPTKAKPLPKKPTSTAVNKRQPGTYLTKPNAEEDEEDDFDDEEEEVYQPRKTSRGRGAKESDEDYEEEPSDDDYVPQKRTSKGRGASRGKRKRKTSDSEDNFSDDDDDYSPKKSKAKTQKKSPKGKGKGGAKGKKPPARSPRKTTQRSRSRKTNSEDEDEEISLPRRKRYNDDEDEDDSPSRRPQRAARQKRGSYVDDPMIEEALEDFASSESEKDVNEDKDSDFQVEGEEDSGSDWEKTASNSQKQKVSKASKTRTPARGPSKRGAKKKAPRRASRARDDSDDDDDDIMEDDEPYVPRPSKRRGGTLSRESEDSDEGGQKKKRRREPCQYGKKCYRKNPVHFRTFCHPGDSSFDEDGDEKDNSSSKESSRKDSNRASTEKPSRPQRSTAGTRLVTTGGEDDEDDLPDTYDYNDSFIDDGTQKSQNSEADDSDYDAEEDVRGLIKDAKKIIKNKKMLKPVGKPVDSD